MDLLDSYVIDNIISYICVHSLRCVSKEYKNIGNCNYFHIISDDTIYYSCSKHTPLKNQLYKIIINEIQNYNSTLWYYQGPLNIHYLNATHKCEIYNILKPTKNYHYCCSDTGISIYDTIYSIENKNRIIKLNNDILSLKCGLCS